MPSDKYTTSTNEYTRTGNSLGNGGAGHVYEVSSGNNVYALKILDKDSAKNGQKLKRFMREMRYCYRGDNPSIIRVLDDGYQMIGEQKVPFYVMDLYSDSYEGVLSKNTLPVKDRLKMLCDLFDGIASFHEAGNIHRDIKPKNILYDQAGQRLVLADFGCAHLNEEIAGAAIETRVNDRLGNANYSAPEQRVPAGKVDYKADIYALGLILNETFTGQIPLGVGFKEVSQVDKNYAFLDQIIHKMMMHDAEQRYDSLRSVSADIRSGGIGRGRQFHGAALFREAQSGEIERIMTDFANSRSYAKTHELMPQIESILPLLSKRQQLTLLESACKNSQILDIVLDQDVNSTLVPLFMSYGDLLSETMRLAFCKSANISVDEAPNPEIPGFEAEDVLAYKAFKEEILSCVILIKENCKVATFDEASQKLRALLLSSDLDGCEVKSEAIIDAIVPGEHSVSNEYFSKDALRGLINAFDRMSSVQREAVWLSIENAIDQIEKLPSWLF